MNQDLIQIRTVTAEDLPTFKQYLERTNYSNDLGYTVIRFENKFVFDYLPSVLQEISNNFKC